MKHATWMSAERPQFHHISYAVLQQWMETHIKVRILLCHICATLGWKPGSRGVSHVAQCPRPGLNPIRCTSLAWIFAAWHRWQSFGRDGVTACSLLRRLPCVVRSCAGFHITVRLKRRWTPQPRFGAELTWTEFRGGLIMFHLFYVHRPGCFPSSHPAAVSGAAAAENRKWSDILWKENICGPTVWGHYFVHWTKRFSTATTPINRKYVKTMNPLPKSTTRLLD